MKPFAPLLALSLLALPVQADDILEESSRLFSDEALERACDVLPAWNAKDMIDIRKFGAVGMKRTYDKSSATPPQKNAAQMVNGAMMKKHEITAKDQLDWIAIQAALIQAGKGKNMTVVIPAGTYYLSREVWIPSFTRVIWQEGAQVVMVGKSIAGTVVSNINPYNRAAYHHYDDLACRIVLINPRIDAGGALGIKGENGLSFANGAKNIIISGGEIINARWGTMADVKAGYNGQGGRGIQLEQGVANISVIGTVVRNSSIGFSSSAGISSRTGNEFKPWRGGLPGEIQSLDKAYNILFQSVTANTVEVPFIFGNSLYGMPAYDTFENQKVTVRDAVVINSGVLRTGINDHQPGAYKPGDANLLSQSAIIVGMGGKNITFHNLTVQNPTTGAGAVKIGAILHAYGKNVKVYGLTASGLFTTLFNFSGDMLNLKSRAFLVENMEVRSAKLSGKTDTLQRYDAALTRGSTLVGGIDIRKLSYNKKNVASLLGPEVLKFNKDLKSKIVMQYIAGNKKPYDGRTASIVGLERYFKKFF